PTPAAQVTGCCSPAGLLELFAARNCDGQHRRVSHRRVHSAPRSVHFMATTNFHGEISSWRSRNAGHSAVAGFRSRCFRTDLKDTVSRLEKRWFYISAPLLGVRRLVAAFSLASPTFGIHVFMSAMRTPRLHNAGHANGGDCACLLSGSNSGLNRPSRVDLGQMPPVI